MICSPGGPVFNAEVDDAEVDTGAAIAVGPVLNADSDAGAVDAVAADTVDAVGPAFKADVDTGAAGAIAIRCTSCGVFPSRYPSHSSEESGRSSAIVKFS